MMSEQLGATGGVVFLVFMAFSVTVTILWVVALIDCVKHDDRTYQAVGSSKPTWILVVVLLGGLGALIYWFSMRAKLRAAASGVQPAFTGQPYANQYGNPYGNQYGGPQGYGNQAQPPQQQYGQPQQYGQQPPYDNNPYGQQYGNQPPQGH